MFCFYPKTSMNVLQVMVDAIRSALTHQVHISAAATWASPKVDIVVKVGFSEVLSSSMSILLSVITFKKEGRCYFLTNNQNDITENC